MEKVVELKGIEYKPSEFFYFVKKLEDGKVYLCKAAMKRAKK